MAVKAQILLWAMSEYPQEEYFLYLDSDIYAYSRFEELETILPQAEIVLTPHHVHDEDSLEGIYNNMLRTLLCGTFNSGFIAVRRSTSAYEFLQWWNRKLETHCYKDESSGLYFEQRWLDVAVSFFDITVLRESGYNVANWNISKRCLAKCQRSDGYLVNGKPLRFFHFSMVDAGRDLFYMKKQLSENNPVFTMREKYIKDVGTFDVDSLSRTPWSYDKFRSGELIAEETRGMLRGLPQLLDAFPDPFRESNAALAFAQARMNKG